MARFLCVLLVKSSSHLYTAEREEGLVHETPFMFIYTHSSIYIFSIYYIAIYLQRTMLNCCIMHCTFIDVKSL